MKRASGPESVVLGPALYSIFPTTVALHSFSTVSLPTMVALTGKEKAQKRRDNLTEEEKEADRKKARDRGARSRALKRCVFVSLIFYSFQLTIAKY